MDIKPEYRLISTINDDGTEKVTIAEVYRDELDKEIAFINEDIFTADIDDVDHIKDVVKNCISAFNLPIIRTN